MVKIFTNFDTKFDDKLLDEAEKKFGKDNVCFVRRDPIYLIMKVFLPIVYWLFLVLLLLGFYYGLRLNLILYSFGNIMIWGFLIVSGSALAYYILGKLIDYYLDFTIITPKQISNYDQTWIFKRSSRSLDISKIKSISVIKKGFLMSVFDYGTIVFFSEGDQALGDIKLKYINNPYRLKKKISHVLHSDGSIPVDMSDE